MGLKLTQKIDRILDGISILIATSKHLSATKAAQELNITPATALRKLSDMEAALGTRLFDRSHSGLIPTSALDLILPKVLDIRNAAIGIKTEADAFDPAIEGSVKIAVLPGVATYFLSSYIAAFHAKYPNIMLEMMSGAEVVDLVMREADIALRCIEPTSGDLISRRLMNFDLAMVCSPELAERVKGTSAADFPWVVNSDEMANTANTMLGFLKAVVPHPRIVFCSAQTETLLNAAKSGVGAMVCAKPLADAVGGLVALPVPLPPMPSVPLYMVTNRVLRRVPRIAAVWDWLERILDDSYRQDAVLAHAPSLAMADRGGLIRA